MKRFVASVVVSVGLAGCAVNPRSMIVEATSPEDVTSHSSGMVAAYYLPKTQLDISFKKPAEVAAAPAAVKDGGSTATPQGKTQPGKEVAQGTPGKATSSGPWTLEVKNSQVEDASHRYLLIQKSDLLSRTTLNVSKTENTDLPKEIGSEVVDNRATLITNVAAVAKVGIGLLVSSERAATLTEVTATWPGPVGTFDVTTADGSDTYTHKTVTALTVVVGPPPVTAYTYDRARILYGRTGNGFFYSACRPVVVAYDPGGGAERYVWKGKVADPAWQEFIPYPRKGKITFHSQCGSSLATEKDPNQTTDALISTAAAQAAAVVEAYEKAKKE